MGRNEEMEIKVSAFKGSQTAYLAPKTKIAPRKEFAGILGSMRRSLFWVLMILIAGLFLSFFVAAQPHDRDIQTSRSPRLFERFHGPFEVNAGLVDASFNGNISDGPTTGRVVAVQPDGKIVVGADPLVNGVQTNGIARLNVDGTYDTSFNPTISAYLFVIRIQNDGKILIGGESTAGRIARLNSNGSVDASFLPGSGPNAGVQDVLLLPDGKIMIAGSFTQFNGSPISHIAVLNANGVLDQSFSPSVINNSIQSMALQPDGKVIIVGDFNSRWCESPRRCAIECKRVSRFEL